jgi:glycosyltransferase involved in cell wall biosynthesis
MLISVAIPTYGYNGRGVEFLDHNLSMLAKQSFKDFEVVFSDHSVDDTICDYVHSQQHIETNWTYVRCSRGRGIISPNLNNAIDHCSGEYVKVLFQDDFLYNERALLGLAICTEDRPVWMMSEFVHTNDGISFYKRYDPHFTMDIWTGNNLMGCPSGLMFRRKHNVRFDESLNMLMDVDYYYRMYLEYGLPYKVGTITYANRTWGKRLTDTIPQDEINREMKIVNEKYSDYGNNWSNWVQPSTLSKEELSSLSDCGD